MEDFLAGADREADACNRDEGGRGKQRLRKEERRKRQGKMGEGSQLQGENKANEDGEEQRRCRAIGLAGEVEVDGDLRREGRIGSGELREKDEGRSGWDGEEKSAG